MSEKFWMEKLSQQLRKLPTVNGQRRIALVGIGNELRGDDAAGIILARSLARQPHGAALQVIEAGTAPANCFGLLKRWHPDLIIFVDAADMGVEPGGVCWLNWHDVITGTGSTHHFSLKVMAEYLSREVGCPVSLLGIQPADTAVAASLSPPVALAVQQTVQALIQVLSPVNEEAHT